MTPLIGALTGFLSSAFPSVFKLINNHQDKKHELELRKHELELLKLQIGENKNTSFNRLEEVRLQSQASELSSLHTHAFVKTKTWVDSLVASVRPTITYVFFLMYIGIKIYLVITLETLEGVWGEGDETIFSTIISFWFGSRTLNGNGKQHIQKK